MAKDIHPVDVFVGQRLRQRRISLGITQEDMANALGLSFQQVQKYEKGMNRMSSSRLWEIGRIVGVEVEPLIGEQFQQALDFKCVLEHHLDLGRGLLHADQGVDPLARHHVHDREADPAGSREMCGVPYPDPVRFPTGHLVR